MNLDNSIKVNVVVQEQDLVSFNYGYIWKSKATRYFLFLAVIIVPSAIYGLFRGVKLDYHFIMPGLLLMYFISLPITLKKQAKKSIETNKNLQKENHYNFSGSNIEVTSKTGNAKLTWEEVFKVMETKNCFGLFIGHNIFHLIPKRCFSGYDQINDFRDLVKSNLDAKKIIVSRVF